MENFRLHWCLLIIIYVNISSVLCDENCREEYNRTINILPEHYIQDPRRPWRRIPVLRKVEEQIIGIDVNCENISLPLQHTVQSTCNGCQKTLIITSSSLPVLPESSFNVFQSSFRLILINLNISKILRGAFSSQSIVELYLSDNSIREIGFGIFNLLSELEILDLSNNYINILAMQSFDGMKSLKTLNLSYNNLVSFSFNSLGSNMSPMDSLDLSFNNLTSATVNNKVRISSLFLNNNNFEVLDFCPHLFNTVNLCYNHIKKLSLDNCTLSTTKLRVFDASNNNILHIDPFYFGDASSLHDIKLNNNNISDISNGVFNNMINLDYLNISNNHLRSFSYGTFDSLSNLRVMDLSNNNLKYLSKALHSLNSVEAFYVQNNQLQNINLSQMVSYFPKLKKIFLDNNNFTCENLVEIVRQLKVRNVEILHNDLRNTTNVHGISCEDTPEASSSSIKDDNESNKETLKNYFDDIVNSTLYKKVLEHFYYSGVINDKKINSSNKSSIDQYLAEIEKDTRNFTDVFKQYMTDQNQYIKSEKLVNNEVTEYNKMVAVLSINTVFMILLCSMTVFIGYVLFKTVYRSTPKAGEHVELLIS